VGEHDAIVATHLPGLEQRWHATVAALIDVVFDGLPDAQHALKWGQLTFTRDGDWHHWICAITATKSAVKLVIHKGALLADPSGVMDGRGRYTRSIAFRSAEQVDAAVVAPILREAAARQTEL
jgi:hypothetical protein